MPPRYPLLHGLVVPCRRGTDKPLCPGFSGVARGPGGARGATCRAALVVSRSKNLVPSPTARLPETNLGCMRHPTHALVDRG